MAVYVSIIIPVRNDPHNLRICLQAIFKSQDSDFECIVIDDASNDRLTRTVMAEFPVQRIYNPVRRGPGFCRNLGARAAKGDILFFVDADVQVYPDTIARVACNFRENEIDALVGSYDKQPGADTFFAQYKNLFHHFVHQNLAGDVCTFWTGCGAVRKEVFQKVNGFSAIRTIEDIELGLRLAENGCTIRLDKELQVKHLKRWTFISMLKSDIRDRAIPWTRLSLSRRSLPNSLNLTISQRLSVVLAFVVLFATLALPLMGTFETAFVAVDGFAFLGLVFINRQFYRFFRREKGIWFALRVLPVHFLYFIYCGVSFMIGATSVLIEGIKSPDELRSSKDTVGALHVDFEQS